MTYTFLSEKWIDKENCDQFFGIENRGSLNRMPALQGWISDLTDGSVINVFYILASGGGVKGTAEKYQGFKTLQIYHPGHSFPCWVSQEMKRYRVTLQVPEASFTYLGFTFWRKCANHFKNETYLKDTQLSM